MQKRNLFLGLDFEIFYKALKGKKKPREISAKDVNMTAGKTIAS